MWIFKIDVESNKNQSKIKIAGMIQFPAFLRSIISITLSSQLAQDTPRAHLPPTDSNIRFTCKPENAYVYNPSQYLSVLEIDFSSFLMEEYKNILYWSIFYCRGWQEPYEVQQGEVQIPADGKEQPQAPAHARGTQLGADLHKKTWQSWQTLSWIWVNSMPLLLEGQRYFWLHNAKYLQLVERCGPSNLVLMSPHLECCVQFCTPSTRNTWVY